MQRLQRAGIRSPLSARGGQVRHLSLVGRIKRYFLVSPRQQALMQEAPYSARKAEEVRRSRIMGVDNAIRSNGSKHFDKSREEFSLDYAFVLPFAIFALLVFGLIAVPSVWRNQNARDEAIKAMEERYGRHSGQVCPLGAPAADNGVLVATEVEPTTPRAA